MSQFTYFTLSSEKGLRGNIGKTPVYRGKDDNAYADVMLFLVPNSNEAENQSTQIVNVHFPKAAFSKLKEFGLGDYIQVSFDRIDLIRGMSKKTGQEELYITVKASGIKLLRKAPKKDAQTSNSQTKNDEQDWK